MARIAVFDSGLGSLSVIRPIQKRFRSEIVYFADQDSYPYGTKPARELRKIIDSTIHRLEERFSPDLVVVASNTPTLLLGPDRNGKILGVYPPLEEAVRRTKSGKIAVLATRSVVNSPKLQQYIRRHVPSGTKVFKIDATPLVDLVESGMFISKKQSSIIKIRKVLKVLLRERIDVATLSSTHLPFLLPLLRQVFPGVSFLDPADSVAERVAGLLGRQAKSNRLRIYASGDTGAFQKKLLKVGIRRNVSPL